MMIRAGIARGRNTCGSPPCSLRPLARSASGQSRQEAGAQGDSLRYSIDRPGPERFRNKLQLLTWEKGAGALYGAISTLTYAYAPYPILLRMAKIMLSYYLGHRESQGRYLTARAEVLTVAWIQHQYRHMLKLLPTTLCPVALPILSRFFPNSVHPLYMNLGYEPLKIGFSRLNLAKRKTASRILSVYKNLIEKSKGDTQDRHARVFVAQGRRIVVNASLSPYAAAKDISEHCTVDRLSYLQGCRIAKFLDLPLPYVLPRSKIYSWADWVIKRDAMLSTPIIRDMGSDELVHELTERGYKVNIMHPPDRKVLASFLEEHLEYTSLMFSTLESLNPSPGRSPLAVSHSIASVIETPSSHTMALSSLLVIRAASRYPESPSPPR